MSVPHAQIVLHLLAASQGLGQPSSGAGGSACGVMYISAFCTLMFYDYVCPLHADVSDRGQVQPSFKQMTQLQQLCPTLTHT